MPFYGKEKSKVRMVVLKPHKHENQVFYSPIQENRKPTHHIVNGMLNRLLKKLSNWQCIQFYESGELIYEIKN